MLMGVQSTLFRDFQAVSSAPRSQVGNAGPVDHFTPGTQPGGEIQLRDMLRFTAPGVSSADRAIYASVVKTMGGQLGLTQADHKVLRQAYARDPQLQALLAADKPRAGAQTQARGAAEVKHGLLERMGDFFREEAVKLGEKCVKTAENLAKAAKAFEAVPKMAKMVPGLTGLAQGIGMLGNTLRGGTESDLKQMIANFVKVVKELAKLMTKLPVKFLAKASAKLAPVLGEAALAWDIYAAGRKSAECSKRGDKTAALAWGVVAGLNTLAFSLRSTCDLAAAITALSAGGAAPATCPLMTGCEAVVGVLAGTSEMVATVLD